MLHKSAILIIFLRSLPCLLFLIVLYSDHFLRSILSVFICTSLTIATEDGLALYAHSWIYCDDFFMLLLFALLIALVVCILTLLIAVFCVFTSLIISLL